MAFTHTIRLRLSHTDAAGVAFFVQPLVLHHTAFEALLDELGCSVASILRERKWAMPIVEASVQQTAPLHVGDDVTFTFALEKLGKSSLIVVSTMTKGAGVAVGRCRTVHVAIDATGSSTPLPAELVERLRQRLS
jgi:acyl-CoA thioesterase FadM